MRALVRQAMEEGAIGVGTSLIYPPASFAETDELVALTTEAAQCGGRYISHMRSEGDRLLESIDELIEISRRSGAPAEIYHLKQAGRANWGKIDEVIAQDRGGPCSRAPDQRRHVHLYGRRDRARRVDAAVGAGRRVDAMLERLKDPATVARIKKEMVQPGNNWENLYYHAGPDRVLLASLTDPSLKPLIGKTVAEVAKMRGVSPEEAVIDLVLADKGRVGAVYFLMNEDNVRRQTALPWVSFGSDAEASGARRRIPEIQHASARLRQFRAVPRPICPRRKGRAAGRGGAAADVASGEQSRASRPRAIEARDGRRCRLVRSGGDRRPRDLREADAICDRRKGRVRQRGSGVERRRAHRRQARTLRQGSGMDRMARRRRMPDGRSETLKGGGARGDEVGGAATKSCAGRRSQGAGRGQSVAITEQRRTTAARGSTEPARSTAYSGWRHWGQSSSGSARQICQRSLVRARHAAHQSSRPGTNCRARTRTRTRTTAAALQPRTRTSPDKANKT